jgi:hypothetical protein
MHLNTPEVVVLVVVVVAVVGTAGPGARTRTRSICAHSIDLQLLRHAIPSMVIEVPYLSHPHKGSLP